MKHNLNKNTLFSIILLLCFNTNIQSLEISFPTCSFKGMSFDGLRLVPPNTIHSPALTIDNSKPSCMDLSQNHHNYLSGQLISSSLYNEHIQNIYSELTPEKVKTLVIQRHEDRMTVLDELCAIEILNIYYHRRIFSIICKPLKAH